MTASPQPEQWRKRRLHKDVYPQVLWWEIYDAGGQVIAECDSEENADRIISALKGQTNA